MTFVFRSDHLMNISTNKNTTYTKSKNNPSFLVIFLPVLMNKNDNKAATIKNIRAIKKGEKSVMVKGKKRPIIPNTNVALTITDPIKSPNTKALFPSRADTTAK